MIIKIIIIFYEMDPVDDFTRNLIIEYSKGFKTFDFEESLIETLFLDQKYDLIIFAFEKGFILTDKMVGKIRGLGNLKLYQYLHLRKRLKLNDYLMELTIINGDLETVKWLRENGCPWDKFTCDQAVKYCKLEILQWCRNNGCPWSEITCAYAARNGCLEILKWCRDNGCPWDERTCINAVKNGHMEILQWCRSQTPPCPWSSWAIKAAILRWQMNPNDIVKTNCYSGLDFLRWLRSPSELRSGWTASWQDPPCPWSEWVCLYAIEIKNLEGLRWLIENGCPYNLGILKSIDSTPEIKEYLATL